MFDLIRLEATLHLVEGLGFRGLRVGAASAQEIPISALIDARVRNPLGSEAPLRLEQIGGFVELYANEEDEAPMAVLPIQTRSPISQEQEGDLLQVTLQLDANKDALRLKDGGRAFAEFIASQINVGASSLMYKARITALVESPFGPLNVRDMQVTGNTRLLDAGPSDGSPSGLADIDFAVDAIRFEAPPDGRKALGFAAAVALKIPLDLTIHLGPMTLQLLFPVDEIGGPREGSTPTEQQEQQEEAPLVPLGVLELPGFHLEGGTARLQARGFIEPAEKDLPHVSAFISRMLSGSSPQVVVRGIGISTTDGAPAPDWLQAAVQSILVSAPLPHVEALVASTFSDLEMHNMRLGALPEGDTGVRLGATIKTTVKSPFGDDSPIEIQRVGVDIQLLEKHKQQQQQQQQQEQQQQQQQDTGAPARRLQQQEAAEAASDDQKMRPIGRLVVAEKPVQQVGMVVAIDVSETLSFDDGGDAFSGLALEMMQNITPVEVGVIGTASVLLQSVIGELHLHGVPIRSLVRIQGLGLFQDETLETLASSALENLRISDIKPASSSRRNSSGASEAPRALALQTMIQLPVMPDLGVDLRSLVFTVAFEGEIVAVVVIPSMQLKGNGTGDLVDLRGIVKPANNESFSRLATSFFTGGNYSISVQGAPDAFGAPSDSALGLAVSLSGVEGSPPPRWLRQVLAGVAFDVPVAPSIDGGAESTERLMKEVVLLGVDVDLSGPRNPFIEAELNAVYAFPPQFNVAHKVSPTTFLL